MVEARPPLQELGVQYERNGRGQLVAVEVVAAPRWSPQLLSPIDETRADVRVIVLSSGRPPDDLPPWVGVVAAPLGIAEDLAGASGLYSRPPLEGSAVRRVARTLVPANGPRPEVEFGDFLAAGAAAARHPAPVPADAPRRLELVREFAREHAALGPLARLDRDDLEWHVIRRFGSPDAFATAVLLERLRERAPDLASTVQMLHDTRIDESTPEWVELALDRRALIAIASPWRLVEGADDGAPLAAVRAWLRRFEAARSAVSERWRERARALARRVESEMVTVRGLERLNSITALGPADGEQATALIRSLRQDLVSFDPAAAHTVLGPEPPLFSEVERALETARTHLEVRRQRLASATVSVVLDQPGGPDVSRLVQAIQACDIDGIERALDARLAAHIEAVLTQRPTTLLGLLTARYSEVSVDNLEEIVAEFRELLVDAIETSQGRAIPLS